MDDNNGWIALKWRKLNHYEYKANYGEYEVYVLPFGLVYPYWEIKKDGVVIDKAIYHHPVTTDFNKELAAKVQAEKYFNEILPSPPKTSDKWKSKNVENSNCN